MGSTSRDGIEELTFFRGAEITADIQRDNIESNRNQRDNRRWEANTRNGISEKKQR